MKISHKFLALCFLFSLLAVSQNHAMQPGGGRWKKPTIITALLATVGAVAYKIHASIKEKHEIAAASCEIRNFVDILQYSLEGSILDKPDRLFQSDQADQDRLSTLTMLMGTLRDAHYTQALGIQETLLDELKAIASQDFTKLAAVEITIRHIFAGPVGTRIIGIWRTLNPETQEQLFTHMRRQNVHGLVFETFNASKHTT